MTRWKAVAALLWLTACGDDSTGGGGAGGGGSGGDGASDGQGGQPTSGGGDNTGGTPTGGSPAAGGSGGGVQQGTAGCGVALSDPTGEWVAKQLDVGGVTRDYFVWLPVSYDPERAYPILYQFHGCSDSPNRENNNVPVQDESGEDAVIVRGRAVSSCWEIQGDGPDVAFYDALVVAMEGAYCADPERRFAAGYSSGAFMTHLLSCVRGSTLRGVASIAGGLGGNNCTGQVAALMIHDTNDSVVAISASQQARDRYLAENACGDTTTPFDPAPCEQYNGCAEGLPVVFCQTAGQDHARQDGLAAPAFWNFLSSL